MKGAKNIVAPAVTEFLWLFMNASYAITDSFHGTAFSLNLCVPFAAIAPDHFSTRLLSVLELTGTTERMLEDLTDVELLGRSIDFDTVAERLAANRSESLDFLKGALDG